MLSFDAYIGRKYLLERATRTGVSYTRVAIHIHVHNNSIMISYGGPTVRCLYIFFVIINVLFNGAFQPLIISFCVLYVQLDIAYLRTNRFSHQYFLFDV